MFCTKITSPIYATFQKTFKMKSPYTYSTTGKNALKRILRVHSGGQKSRKSKNKHSIDTLLHAAAYHRNTNVWIVQTPKILIKNVCPTDFPAECPADILADFPQDIRADFPADILADFPQDIRADFPADILHHVFALPFSK